MLHNHSREERWTLPRDRKSQSDKFKNAARELGAEEDENRWEERLKRVAKQKVEKSE